MLGLGNGLMVLSTQRLNFRLEPFGWNPFDEKLFARKGILVCRIDGGAMGKDWSLLNIHTTAGGMCLHPESQKANLIRAGQIDQILHVSNADPGITVIAGDLNAGPGVSEETFRQVLDAGFESTYDSMHAPDSYPTWDPTNVLNRNGPHQRSPPQRIDHVFVRRVDLAEHRVNLRCCDICCREEVVPTPEGLATISDHFGLCVDLEVRHQSTTTGDQL